MKNPPLIGKHIPVIHLDLSSQRKDTPFAISFGSAISEETAAASNNGCTSFKNSGVEEFIPEVLVGPGATALTVQPYFRPSSL